ncbi:hypothetical protein [Nocardia sp. NPDC004711]
MVATLTVSTLVEAARRVGVELREVTSGGNLYVWHTPTLELAVLYVGKSASDARLKEERSWQYGGDPTTVILSGIVTLLRVNRAVPQALLYDPVTFDGGRWRSVRESYGWNGTAFDLLEAALPEGEPLPVTEVEKLLVRIAVRYGAPIGNSQFASQWEGPINTVSDTLAALAVGADQAFVVPGPMGVGADSPHAGIER